MTTDRGGLRSVPVADVLRGLSRRKIIVTISVGQPVGVFHQVAYDQGAYLLELDVDEQPVGAYHRAPDDDEQPF